MRPAIVIQSVNLHLISFIGCETFFICVHSLMSAFFVGFLIQFSDTEKCWETKELIEVQLNPEYGTAPIMT